MNQRRFGQKLTEKGLTRIKRGTGWWWSGMDIIDTGEVGEVTHFSDPSDPLSDPSKDDGSLKKSASTLDTTALSDPSDPFFGENSVYAGAHAHPQAHAHAPARAHTKKKDCYENGSHGSLNTNKMNENSDLQSDPSSFDGSLKGHLKGHLGHSSTDYAVDYLHSKLPRGLLKSA